MNFMLLVNLNKFMENVFNFAHLIRFAALLVCLLDSKFKPIAYNKPQFFLIKFKHFSSVFGLEFISGHVRLEIAHHVFLNVYCANSY